MRYTKKTEYGYEGDCCNICQCSDKLGLLEDIEDEFNVSFDTLFEAIKKGIWAIYHDKIFYLGIQPLIYYPTSKDKKTREFAFVLIDIVGEEHIYWLKDYGKTWSLTKEELE